MGVGIYSKEEVSFFGKHKEIADDFNSKHKNKFFSEINRKNADRRNTSKVYLFPLGLFLPS